MITRVKGMQDTIDMRQHRCALDTIRRHLGLYSLVEIATPIVEQAALFQRSLGMETDVVSKEMFIIQPRMQEDDELLCLRPEATAGIVRTFIEHPTVSVPWKVFTYGPMFRYERPQKGRYRQFHQVSIEMIGVSAVADDAQLLVMLDRLFSHAFQLQEYALLINYLGCAEDRILHRKKLVEFLAQVQSTLCQKCIVRMEKNPLRVFDCKEASCQKIYVDAPLITGCLCVSCQAEWQELQDRLELLSVSYMVKPTLVRGLDYYNKTVFEFVSRNLGAQDAFCAGGRYDQLVGQLSGANDQPSIGAAIGFERLLILLEQKYAPEQSSLAGTVATLIPVAKEQEGLVLLLADHLRSHMISVEAVFDGSIKQKMKQANRLESRFVIIIGEDEQREHSVMLKDMVTGLQKRMLQTELPAYFKQLK